MKENLYEMTYDARMACWYMQSKDKCYEIERGDQLEFHIEESGHSFTFWGDIQHDDGDWYIMVGATPFFLDHRASYHLARRVRVWE